MPAKLNDVISSVAGNPNITETDREKLVADLQEVKPFEDLWIYRAVVMALGLTVLITMGGIIFLASRQSPTTIPDGLVALGSAALGALAGLLAPAPGS